MSKAKYTTAEVLKKLLVSDDEHDSSDGDDDGSEVSDLEGSSDSSSAENESDMDTLASTSAHSSAKTDLLTSLQWKTNPCHSFPCLNGGSCTTIAEDSYSCNCPSTFTGPKCQTELNDVNATSSCGDLMKSTPYDPSPGWTTLCQITTNDTALVNTPCGDLLQGLPIYGDSVGLLEAGGNFGCWLTKQYPDDIQRGCRNGYQQTHMLASCLSCTHLIVCLLYP